jgi:hypothetical protein
MDLQTFVAESLRQIINAVAEVQREQPHGARVNPAKTNM